LFFVAIGQLFGLAQPLLLSFPTERPIFLREHATGTYHAFTYFLSNLFVEIPAGMVQIAVVWICTYWIAGLQGNWFFLWLATCLLGFVSASTAVLIGAIVPTVETAIEVSGRRWRGGTTHSLTVAVSHANRQKQRSMLGAGGFGAVGCASLAECSSIR
jgi:ABC-type multidrug transport system permease subunit